MRVLTFIALIGLAGALAIRAEEPLALVRSIPLPGVQGRIDHLALDSTGHRLFVAALGNDAVEVVDLKSGTRIRSLPGFREPQGIAVLPDRNQIAVANGEGEGVQLIGGDDYRPARMIRLGDDADNLRYDAAAGLLYVGYGSGALAAINMVDGSAVGKATLAGHPESFQLEQQGPRIFVNVPTARRIAVVDRKAMKTVGAWPVTEAGDNFPMALDGANDRLFIGCRRPAQVLVYDTRTGTLIGSADTVGDSDDLFYDTARKRLYVSGGGGFIDVFDSTEGGRLTRVARVATATGARTSLFAPGQKRLYLAVPHRGSRPAEIRVYEAR